MSDSPVTLDMDGAVAVVSVDSPPVNTLNAAVRTGLFAAIKDIRSRPEAKAVVLVCKGSTFFSGADISEFSGPPKEAEYRDLFGSSNSCRCRSWRECTASPWEVDSKSHSPAITGSPSPARALAFPKSLWASFPAPAARSACRASSGSRKLWS